MKIEFRNYRKICTTVSKDAFSSWFSVDKYWGGALVHISIKHYAIVLDFRDNLIHDLANGL